MISAIVLAAGRSSRMGALKMTKKVGKKTVIENALHSVTKAGLSDIVVVLGYKADEVSAVLGTVKARKVLNPSFEEGISSSIRVGLSNLQAHSDAALIMLADQPFVKPHSIKKVIAEYKKSKAALVVPTYKGDRGNPVLLDRSVFREALKLRGDVGARKLIDEGSKRVRFVEVDDPGVVLDIDTQSDLAMARMRMAYYVVRHAPARRRPRKKTS